MQDYTNDRLLNMLDQSYSFNKDQVSDVIEEIKKRKLLSENEIKVRFAKGLKKGIIIQQEEENQRILDAKKLKKRNKLNKTIYGIVIACTLIGSILAWHYTGSIFILALSPTVFGGIALKERKTIFRK